MEVCRGEPLRVPFLYPFLPVVKPRGTVPFPVPPVPAVLLPVIVGFRLHLQQVPLFTQQFLLFRTYTDPNVLGTGIGFIFCFLYLPVPTVQQLDREVWAVPVYEYMTARPFFRSLRARYSLVGIMGFPVFPTTAAISFLSGLRLPSGIRTVYGGSPSAACALRLL